MHHPARPPAVHVWGAKGAQGQRWLYLRGQLADHNRDLSEAANQACVVTALDFAIFHDHGYMGLYGGLRAQDIHRRKGLKKGQQILDHMGSTELAANLFHATQTEEKLRREQIATKDGANAAHYQVGQVVRRTIQELGGTPPEQLPTLEASIKQLEAQERTQRRQAERNQQMPQLPLFSDDDECTDDSADSESQDQSPRS